MRNFILIIILLTPYLISGQNLDSITKQKHTTRYVIWTTPVQKNTTINGLALGLMAVPWLNADSLIINGLNVDISPFAIFGACFAVIGTLISPLPYDKGPPSDIASSKDFTDSVISFGTEIRGASISGGLTRETKVTGFSVNVLTSFAAEVEGVEITPIMNLHYSFKGLLIAGLRNKTTTGKGVQIGLINTCKEGKLVQIGLINRIGKRVTPGINLSFGKRKTATNTQLPQGPADVVD